MDDKQTQPKRRGRKPKGGKLIANITNKNDISDENKKTAVIVHIKCTTNDLKTDSNEFTYHPTIETIHPYSDVINESKYETINQITSNINQNNNNIINENNSNHNIDIILNNNNDNNNNNNNYYNNYYNHDDKYNYNISTSSIEDKLKDLSHKLDKMDLHNNNTNSSCFECTYNFDNLYSYSKKLPMIKYLFMDVCTPECALAYLLKELVDDTLKWKEYIT